MVKRISLLLALAATATLLFSCSKASRQADTVVVYVSEDQVFSEPILRDFETATGIRVKAVYDTEEAKGTGAMNRLLAEAGNPQADVYWANEPIRAEVLKQRGITAPYVSPNAGAIPEDFKDPEGYWTGFSARARVLVVNAGIPDPPSSLLDYTRPQWRGRGVIANPLFGTTTTQMAALFTLRGDDRARAFLQDLKKNQTGISTDNGESTDLVVSGQDAFSLVDSDDAINRLRQGKPLKMIYPDQGREEPGCLIVPNAVVFIKGAPHPENARKLLDYLLSPETERKLAFARCAQIPLHEGVPKPAEVPDIAKLKTTPVKYAEVAQKLQEIQPYLKSWVGY